MAVTDDVSERLIRLPLWVGMEPDIPGRVVGELRAAIARA
jgi:dTDP-4-amino-4,6-dideoxygalactose transaminase